MKRYLKIILFSLLSFLLLEAALYFVEAKDFQVLQAKGWVALQERRLMLISLLLMCVVVIPVLVMTVFFSWKYREGNKKAPYRPDWEHSYLAEAIWWGIPCLIIVVLSILTWRGSHELDPFRPLQSDKEPVHVQVVALQWKWLFLYPDEGVASVNYVAIPVGRPVHFEITADAPMNSFWIPQLGGQIYAMPGMRTQLYLVADEVGEFPGMSANLSGKGFSGMRFLAGSMEEEGYLAWLQEARSSGEVLDRESYEALAEPSQYNPVATYRLGDENLFSYIERKPMEAE